MRKFLEKFLARQARAYIKRLKPYIVGITGSVGKTSTKEAIAYVLSRRFKVVATPKNYNTEIGLPLTVLELPSGEGSKFKWLGILIRAFFKAHFRATGPDIFVLEYGVDKPGDMDQLLNIIEPDIAVLTNVGVSHMEFFPSQESLLAEKTKLVRAIPAGNEQKKKLVFINGDRPELTPLKEELKASVITYGLRSDLDIVASDIQVVDNIPSKKKLDKEVETLGKSDFAVGTSFKFTQHGKSVPIRLPRVLGKAQIYAILPAIALGTIFGDNLVDIAEHLLSYSAPPGRLSMLAGIKKTLIIDDTYNSAPDSALHALGVLEDLPVEGRKVAVLGDMLELGEFAEKGHREVGKYAAGFVDLLITVGPISTIMAAEARKSGLKSDHVIELSRSNEVENYLQPWLSPGDAILFKGSQGMRLEKAVKAVMAEPLRAKDLLVRQEAKWSN